jgi:hypothetical protein
MVGVAGIAFLPLLPQLWRGFELTRVAWNSGALPSFFRLGLESFYRAHSSHWDLWFAVVLVCCAAGLYAAARRAGWQTVAWLAAWGIGIPLAAFLARERFPFFTTRYLVFTIPAAVLLLGLGLASSPARWAGAAALGIMSLAPWQPFDLRPSYSDFPPLRDLMRFMADEFRPGDRLVVDPALAPQVVSLEWLYYKSLYFAQGDLRPSDPDGLLDRRVWYLYRQGGEDPALSRIVRSGRVQTASWGAWYLHAALFEAPPSDIGIAYGSALRFLGADVDRLLDVHAGDLLPARLWWAADQRTPGRPTVRIELRAADGRLVARFVDPPPAPGAEPLPGLLLPGAITLDARYIRIPYHLDDGMYTLELVIPLPGESAPSSPGSSSQVDRTIEIDRFHLVSFATW